MEVPAPFPGTIVEFLVEDGSKVTAKQKLYKLEKGDSPSSAASSKKEEPPPSREPPKPPSKDVQKPEPQKMEPVQKKERAVRKEEKGLFIALIIIIK